jgi:pyruvate/2-oxoglutarate dehydrogenase complex dihydrolipoamide acyltransferase (E2) component
MGRATLASVGIHLLAALAIPALVWTSASNVTVETISFTHVLRIQIVRPRVVQPPPRAAAPRHSVRPRLSFTKNVHVVARSPSRQASPHRPVATDAPAAAPAVASVARAGAVNAGGAAAPRVTPSPLERSVASEASRQTGGYLPFGAEQPVPVLDPNVRKQLDELNVHVTLVVAVGDDGHTQTIEFQPPVDPQIETRIRSMLADASWDPAVCGGGVSCSGVATIKL